MTNQMKARLTVLISGSVLGIALFITTGYLLDAPVLGYVVAVLSVALIWGLFYRDVTSARRAPTDRK